MQRVIAGRPYRFFKPYRGKFLAGLLPAVFPLYLRKAAGVKAIEFHGKERLRQSLQNGHRVVLACNHSRFSDPMLLAVLSRQLNQPFYYLTNWHAFLEGKAQGWLIRRLGGFSICREGADRRALKAASRIITAGDRPLVIFPEGEVSRTNDHLSPFMRGFSFIVKNASRALAKETNPPGMVIHPVAIRYELMGSIEDSLHKAIDRIEDSRGWKRSRFSLIKRIAAAGKKLLEEKESEHLGSAQKGEICDRACRLKNSIMDKLEEKWISAGLKGCFMSRVNALRSVILRKILEEREESHDADLGKIDLAVRLSNYPENYLKVNPSLERQSEFVQSLEEDAFGAPRLRGSWKAKVSIGENVSVHSNESFLCEIPENIHRRMQGLLESLKNF